MSEEASPVPHAIWQTTPWVNGQSHPTTHNTALVVTNPATGETLAQVAQATDELTLHTIAIAEKTGHEYARWPAQERAAALKRWHSLIVQHADELALLLTLEQGKPLKEAKAEVLYGAAYVEWFAEEAKRISGNLLQSPSQGKELLVLKEPIGVVAAITPWNFPNAMVTRKVAPALAAGCTVILKPAEQTPLSALALAKLAHQAGFPAGSFNVLPADAAQSVQIGTILCNAPQVRKLSFTGSTEVGRILMRQSADTLKKLSLELGGHAPFMVFEDANIDAAIKGLMAAKFRNAGQTCICPNRILVAKPIQDVFVEKLAQSMSQLVLGDGTNPATDIGPLIDANAVAKVAMHVNDAKAHNAQVVLGGTVEKGLWYQPTLLNNIAPPMRIMQEETFGPVAAVMPFNTEEEAITLANSTPFGLAAYAYTQNSARSFRLMRALQFGMQGINTGHISSELMPFGGVKQSGFGREGSVWGIDEYLERKAVTWQSE